MSERNCVIAETLDVEQRETRRCKNLIAVIPDPSRYPFYLRVR